MKVVNITEKNEKNFLRLREVLTGTFFLSKDLDDWYDLSFKEKNEPDLYLMLRRSGTCCEHMNFLRFSDMHLCCLENMVGKGRGRGWSSVELCSEVGSFVCYPVGVEKLEYKEID